MQVWTTNYEGAELETIFDGFDSEVVLAADWRERAPELAARVDALCAPWASPTGFPEDAPEDEEGFARPEWIALVDELTAAGVVESSTLDN